MWNHAVFIVSVLAALRVAATARAQVPAECKAPVDAATKEVTTPHHAYSTRMGLPGKAPTTGEVIFTGSASYVLYKGAWKRLPTTTAEAVQQREDALRTTKFSGCRRLPDELVDGAPAMVYALHTTSDDRSSDVRVWIAKSSGLELREEVDLDPGGGEAKTHVSTRIDYTNVRAPAGAP